MECFLKPRPRTPKNRHVRGRPGHHKRNRPPFPKSGDMIYGDTVPSLTARRDGHTDGGKILKKGDSALVNTQESVLTKSCPTVGCGVVDSILILFVTSSLTPSSTRARLAELIFLFLFFFFLNLSLFFLPKKIKNCGNDFIHFYNLQFFLHITISYKELGVVPVRRGATKETLHQTIHW